MARILYIGDEPTSESIRHLYEKCGHEIVSVGTLADAKTIIENQMHLKFIC